MQVNLGGGGGSTEVLMYNFAVPIHKRFDCNYSHFGFPFSSICLMMLFQEISLNIEGELSA